jgi:hypothetical protein
MLAFEVPHSCLTVLQCCQGDDDHMNLQIHIPDELEDQLREHAGAVGEDLESFVIHAVENSLANLTPATTVERPSRERWFAELKAWAESHPRVNHFVDDSRESIYPDRG